MYLPIFVGMCIGTVQAFSQIQMLENYKRELERKLEEEYKIKIGKEL